MGGLKVDFHGTDGVQVYFIHNKLVFGDFLKIFFSIIHYLLSVNQ